MVQVLYIKLQYMQTKTNMAYIVPIDNLNVAMLLDLVDNLLCSHYLAVLSWSLSREGMVPLAESRAAARHTE